MKRAWICLVISALVACSKQTEEGVQAAAPTLGDPATPIAGDASSAWVEMMGVWAPVGACGDYTKEWRIEGEAFHLHEMHCVVHRLELLQNGVRAVAQCSVEGDDDRVEDVFKFVRREDATLSIINEANEAATDGLMMCGDDLP